MEYLLHAINLFSSIGAWGSAAVLVPSAAVLSGLVPRLGPGRAVSLALRTFRPRLFSRQDVSQRKDDVQTLRGMLSSVNKDQYVVVSGPKGVGAFAHQHTNTCSTRGAVLTYVSRTLNTHNLNPTTHPHTNRQVLHSGHRANVHIWRRFCAC
jgi:hypothetical protein